MNRDAFWAVARDKAVLDRESFADAWGGTGNVENITQTNAEITRFNALNGLTFKQSLKADTEGVRLALLAAQCWYESLADSQAGNERRSAATMARQVTDLRMHLFGCTQLESVIQNSVSVPIHLVGKLLESGLAPAEFLATVNH